MSETGKYLKWRALAILLLAACGGDDNSSGGIATGLPAGQKLSTLTDADVKKACQSVNDGATSVITPAAVKRAFCTEFAAYGSVTYSNEKATADIDKCQELVDACINSTEEDDEDETDVESDEEGENDCEQASAKDVEGCDATVGDYEACVNTVLSEAQRRLSELNCQNAEKIASEEYSNDQLDPTKIPQCKAIMDKCPTTTLGIPFAE